VKRRILLFGTGERVLIVDETKLVEAEAESELEFAFGLEDLFGEGFGCMEEAGSCDRRLFLRLA
jgi:hypothetical protein